MNILTASASRHGSTREIAEAIAGELRRTGHEVAVEEASAISSLDGYDAAMVGRAVYMGKWLPEASAFVERFRQPLASLPIWLFSSGPLGAETPHPPGDPAGLPELVAEPHDLTVS
jgi:menaquinone-dependent protoporphyrinogen oxidase